MDVRVERMPVATLRDVGSEQLRANNDEANDRELDVNWPCYERAETSKQLLLFGAWHDEQLAGYVSGFHIEGHPHHAWLNYVAVDVLFVAKNYRASNAMSNLMHAMRKAAKSLNAEMIQWGAKRDSSFDKHLAHHGRYTLIERHYEESLKWFQQE